jgi:dolichol-phosphate mannosyltransferase
MTWFVIPAFNEERNVPRLLRDLESRPALWIGGCVVLIDDGSTDATAEVAGAYAGPMAVEVLRQAGNQGPGRAFDRGFRHVLAAAAADDLVVTLEADTTSDLDAIEAMLAAARAGADVVLASHHGGGALVNVAAYRRFLSGAAAFAIRRSFAVDARTVSSFFRVYRAAALRRGYDRYGEHFIRERGFACKAELLVKLARLGATVAEVPVALDWSRREGRSKLRVLPTVGGYARLIARHAAVRARAS